MTSPGNPFLQWPDSSRALDSLERSLLGKAEALGVQAARTRALATREPDAAWRSAELVWPLFAKG